MNLGTIDPDELSTTEFVPTQETEIHALEDWKEPFVKVIASPVKRRGLVPALLWACSVLVRTNENSVIICNGGGLADKLVCLINSFLPKKRKTLIFDPFPTSTNKFIKWANARMLGRGATAVVIWSEESGRRISEFLKIPLDNFVRLAYKCNYTKNGEKGPDPLGMVKSDFIFSGGNSARDYETLFKAVDGTGILTIISTTNRELIQGLNVPDNVIVSAITEPYYRRMIMKCRVFVVPIDKRIIRSAGEQNFLNAYYYSTPVVCADDVSASEYIEDGVTGYVVPAGDHQALRERILSLWNDDKLAQGMTDKGRALLYARFTHDHFKKRIMNLAYALNAD